MSQGQGRIIAKIQWGLIEVKAVIPTEAAIHQHRFCNGLILIHCSIWENTGAIPDGEKKLISSQPPSTLQWQLDLKHERLMIQEKLKTPLSVAATTQTKGDHH